MSEGESCKFVGFGLFGKFSSLHTIDTHTYIHTSSVSVSCRVVLSCKNRGLFGNSFALNLPVCIVNRRPPHAGKVRVTKGRRFFCLLEEFRLK